MTSESAAEAPTSSIILRLPSKYTTTKSPTSNDDAFVAPTLDWLLRTWSVTHSTLSMWRTARNVRISYAALSPAVGSAGARERNADLVEYEAATGARVKSVAGTNTAAVPGDTAVWDWRGRGFLFFVSSHWEILGWGERRLPDGGVERWVVTWFTATLFTKEGVDIYSDWKEGGSEGLVRDVLAALRELPAKPLAELCEKDMRPVEIKLPWKER